MILGISFGMDSAFFEMGQSRPLFCLFSSFSTTILQKNCRLQWDSNSDFRSKGAHADHLTTAHRFEEKSWYHFRLFISAKFLHSTTITSASLSNDNQMLNVKWSDGATAKFPAVWLRDNCQCNSCFHQVRDWVFRQIKKLEHVWHLGWLEEVGI